MSEISEENVLKSILKESDELSFEIGFYLAKSFAKRHSRVVLFCLAKMFVATAQAMKVDKEGQMEVISVMNELLSEEPEEK